MTSNLKSSVTELVTPPSAIAEIEALARKSEPKIELLQLPKAALPSGLSVDAPTIGVVHELGSIRLVDLAPFVREYIGKPQRRKGTASVNTLASFIALTNRHAAVSSVVFADANWRKPKFTAVIDYHAEARDAEGEGAVLPVGDDPFARYGNHRIVYEFPLSEAWKTWLHHDGKPMHQAEFAEFLENHIHELASPTQAEVNEARDRFKTTVANPAELIELSRGLEVMVGARVKSRVNLSSGEKEITFETEHKSADGGKIIVPGLFVVNVPAFYQGEALRLFGRLRYRPTSDGVVWFYELYRPDLAIEQRVTDDLLTVADKTGLPTFHGHPEA